MALQELSMCGLSTTKVKYTVAGSCCAQTLWLKQQLSDFGIILNKILLLCDNINVINLTKTQIMHSRTKHIEIKHHFLREYILNGNCEIKFIRSEKQLADLFTKPLTRDRYNYLRNVLGIISLEHVS